jgi:cytochrome c6
MNRRAMAALAILAFSASGMAACKKEQPEKAEAPQSASTPVTPAPVVPGGTAERTGEQLFKQYCASCHPGGGNTMNPKKTLLAKDLSENKITTPMDVVKVMRNPGPGMSKFDEAALPDKDAKLLGDYVLSAFR